jgi:FKBP-type peptidyl-prolyl cis-trans isomerase
MKLSAIKGYVTLLAMAGMALVPACNDTGGMQELRDQEQRFFEIYVGSRYPDAKLEQNGLYYDEHRAGTGKSPGPEEWIIVNHVGYEIPEDKIFVSYIENVAKDNNLDPDGVALYGPFKMQINSQNEGFAQGVSLMKEGGQATILFTSRLGYGDKGNNVIEPYSSLKYEVELLEVIPDIEAYEQERIDTYVDTVVSYDTIRDPDTGAIMYYMIDQATDGQLIETDSAVSLAYTGMLLDGRVFDSADSLTPFEFKMGDSDTPLITGWDLGLLRLREGEKARLLIPYQLAYGETGELKSGLRTIPPYETLLFYIDVLKVGGKIDDTGKPPE